MKGVRRVDWFHGSVLQILRLIKAEGSNESVQVFRFSVAGSGTCNG